MCLNKSLDYPPLFDNLHRPHQVSDINSNVWNDKSDYLELEDVVMLCETYLNDIKEKQFKFKDYMLSSNHQQLCKGGGVSILVKRSLRTKIREDLSLNEPGLVESIFIELEIPGKHNIVLGSLYRIPNSSEKHLYSI